MKGVAEVLAQHQTCDPGGPGFDGDDTPRDYWTCGLSTAWMDDLDAARAAHAEAAVLDWVRERLAEVEDEIGLAVMQPGAVIAAVAEALGDGEVRADGESSAGRISARDELNLHLLATQGRVLGEKPWTTSEEIQ